MQQVIFFLFFYFILFLLFIFFNFFYFILILFFLFFYFLGAGLYDWKLDKELLENGPLQLRKRKELREKFDDVTLLPEGSLDILKENKIF